MARQDLGYLITVNDAQLQAATAHVKAFNAEMARSNLVGRGLDTQFRAVGRRAVEVGKFFTRAFTAPLAVIAGVSVKLAGDFDNSMAKIKGLVGGTDKELKRLRDTALSLSKREVSQGPQALADAMFFLRSVGLSTAQTIKAIGPISRAASAGLGSVAVVTEAVTSVMDAYGFANISAAHATDILVETVTKGKIPPEQLAASLGRVIPIANAMGISFDQVGASLASMTRQGLSANLAVTGLRAILSTFQKGQPQTVKGLASIGTSINAVQQGLTKDGPGLFATLLGIDARVQATFGKIKTADIFSDKTLAGIRRGTAKFGDALKDVREKLERGGSGPINVLSKIFPNIRALTAFLILVGPRVKANAGIFADLADTINHVHQATNRAFAARERQPINQLGLALNQLKATAIDFGEKITPAVAGFVHGLAVAFDFLVHSGGTLKHILKDILIALVILGPGIQIFGRLAQGVSAGIFAIGKFQERALKAALAVRGIPVEADKAFVDANRAVFQLGDSMDVLTAKANEAAASFGSIGAQAQRSLATGAAAGVAVAPVVRGRGAGGTAAAATSGAKAAREATNALAVSEKRMGDITVAEQAKITAAYARFKAAQVAVAEQQEVVNAAMARAVAFGISPGQAGVLREQQKLAEANRVLARSMTAESIAPINGNRQLLVLEKDRRGTLAQLQIATDELAAAEARRAQFLVSEEVAGVTAARAQIVALEKEIVVRGRDITLMREQIALEGTRTDAALRSAALLARTTPTGPFAPITNKAVGVQQQSAVAARNAQGQIVTAANITATKWGTALEGMKAAARGAFSFIAVIFAVEVVSKLIFGGDKARDHLKQNFRDIGHSATVEFATAGLALAGLLTGLSKLNALRAGPTVAARIGAATGGEAAVGGALAGLSLGGALRQLPQLARGLAENGRLAIGLRGKLALAALGFIGLKSAGVSTENIINAALVGMTAKALITTRAIQGIFTAGALQGGLGALLARIGLVTAAFGGWPVALAVAGGLILSQVGPIKAAINSVADAAAGAGDQIDKMFGGGDKNKKGGHFFHDFFKAGLFLKGGVHPLGVGFGPSGEDLRNAEKLEKHMGGIAKSAKLTGDELKHLREVLPGFDTLTKHQKLALRVLVKRGDVDAAGTLLQKFLDLKMKAQVKDAAAFLGKHGFGDVSKFLATATKAARDASKTISDAFGSRLSVQILGAFDAATDRMLDAFDRQTDKILTSFDKQTEKMEARLQFLVKVPKLNETFKIKVDGKTPAERELEALDKVEAKRRAQRDLFDANKQLTTAFLVGDPEAIRQAERARQDAQTEVRRQNLEKRASLERSAADKAIKDGQERFETARAAERDSLARRRDGLRRDLDSTRKLQHDQIEAAIKAQIALVNKGKETIGQFYKNVLGIMKRHNVSVAQAGRDGGKGFADGLGGAIAALRKKVDQSLDHIVKKAQGTSQALKKIVTNIQRIENLDKTFNPSAKVFPGSTSATGSPARGPFGSRQLRDLQRFVAIHPNPTQLQKALSEVGIGIKVPFGLNDKALRGVGESILRRTGVRGLDDVIYYLKHHKLARHATGGVVGGFGEGDIVPALLKPGELILNQGHQEALKRNLGVGGNPAGLFNHIDRMTRSGKRMATGGFAEGGYGPSDDRRTAQQPALGSRGPYGPHGGIRWGGQVFFHPDDLYRWVKAHGSRYSEAQFFNLHPGAAQALGYRGAISKSERESVLANRKPSAARGRNELLRMADAHVLHGAFEHFAKGGFVKTPSPKQLFPGLPPRLTRALRKLILALQGDAIRRERLSQDPRALHLILGGSFKGKGKKRHFVKDAPDYLKKLRRQLDPVWATGIVHRLFPHMDDAHRKVLEGRAAQIQAHPVLAGLYTPTPTGLKRGGRPRLPQQVTNALAAVRGSALTFTGFAPGGGIHGQNNIAGALFEPLRRAVSENNHGALRSLLYAMAGNSAVKLGGNDRAVLRNALLDLNPDMLFKYVAQISRGKVRLASGGMVGGRGSGDIVPAMLTPGELVLNKGHQQALKHALGVAGNTAGLFSHIESLARSGGRYGSGGFTMPESPSLSVPTGYSGGGGTTVMQQVQVDIHDSRNPDETARSVRRELLRHATRNASAPRGRVRNKNIGLS